MPAQHSMSSIITLQEEGLSQMEAEFVHHFASVGLSGPKAAAAAGYEAKNASVTLLQNPKIRTAIAEQYERNARTANFTREDVLHGMKEAIDLSRVTGDPATMVRGWSEIGKIIGAYEKHNQVTINIQAVKTVDDLKTLSREELAELVSQAQAKTIAHRAENDENDENFVAGA